MKVKRYVPRILQDDGMIPFAEVAHYTHLNLIQYVSVADHDAALRRAKAEVAQQALKLAKSHNANGEHQVVVYELQGLLYEHTKRIDARAAQIEEGE